MKVNFITNLPQNEVSGGFSGMNVVAWKAIAARHDVHYVGPINPPTFRSDSLLSKFSKLLGLPRTFFLFSEKRLQTIAREVAAKSDPSADLDFYHGFTPWIRCAAPRPYAAWCDCAFLDYIQIYHKGTPFRASDVKRISEGETRWFNNARGIFLSSKWAEDRLNKTYGVDRAKLGTVGIFGGLEPPSADTWNGNKDFYFISSDYRLKNGSLCRRAMEKVWEKHPDVRLRIVGAKPPPEDLLEGKVTYEGFFRKSDPEQLKQFRAHLANAFAILHPTDADTTAMILIEAAFFGCPAVSVNDFAIPEVLGEGESGILMDRPLTSDKLAQAMIFMLENPAAYRRMRETGRARALKHHTIEAFSSRMQNLIQSAFSK